MPARRIAQPIRGQDAETASVNGEAPGIAPRGCPHPEETTCLVNPTRKTYPSVGAAEVAPQLENVVEPGVVGRRIRMDGIGLAVIAIRCGGRHP